MFMQCMNDISFYVLYFRGDYVKELFTVPMFCSLTCTHNTVSHRFLYMMFFEVKN